METIYIQAPGVSITIESLVVEKAREAVRLIQKLPFYSIIGASRLENNNEVVVFETEIEVGQRTAHDIRSLERIAIIFSYADDVFPEVLALRDSFPKVPHLNLRPREKPRSLCLYEVKYSEIKLRWTTVGFLERIRQWLSLTAKGDLHAFDQPLEPLIASPYYLIIPHDLLRKAEVERSLLVVRRVDSSNGNITLIANKIEDIPPFKDEVPYVAILVKTSPVVHGVIKNQPRNLSELHDLLLFNTTDLLTVLRQELPRLKNDTDWKLLKANIILIVSIPKLRTKEAEPETNELWAFLMPHSVEEIGIDIGIWSKFGDTLASIEFAPDYSKNGSNISILLVNPLNTLSRETALAVSGISYKHNKFLIAGVGALGSQLLMHLIRMGVGSWIVVDEDVLLPHNVSRHALDGRYIGCAKAEALSEIGKTCLDENGFIRFITADILSPGNNLDILDEAYKEVEIIIDATTSVPAARYLACDVDSSARRISVFMNPVGNDSVILVEDTERKYPLDFLEMQYYRFLVETPKVHEHLQQIENPIRYGRSCRDISFILSQELVGLHSSICARGIRKSLESNDSIISMWRCDDECSVTKYSIKPSEVFKRIFNDWTLLYDSALIGKIEAARKAKLPKETGGVLLGSFDLQRRIVYAVDTILSPPDSEEWPTVYIRGCTGLKDEVEKINHITMGMLDYVGEWHSHPGHSTRPSQDDLRAFEWLVEIMDVVEEPALMLIAGEDDHSWFLGEMG